MTMRPNRLWTTGRAGRLAAGLAVATALAAAAAPAADAKVWFDGMQGRVVRWDERVSRRILNCPGNESCRAAVEDTIVYLRRGPITRTAVDPRRLRRIGRISARGTLRFRVPRVAAGRYHLVARARAGESRQLIPASGTFRVVRR
jgi:hypothetical protein